MVRALYPTESLERSGRREGVVRGDEDSLQTAIVHLTNSLASQGSSYANPHAATSVSYSTGAERQLCRRGQVLCRRGQVLGCEFL